MKNMRKVFWKGSGVNAKQLHNAIEDNKQTPRFDKNIFKTANENEQDIQQNKRTRR